MDKQETKIQTQLAERLATTLKATIRCRKMIGSKLFVAYQERDSVFGELWTGTIGPRGALRFEVRPFGGKMYKRTFIPYNGDGR